MGTKEEALEIADELLKKYDLLSVKASFTIRELVKEIEKLQDIRNTKEQPRFARPVEWEF